MAGTEDMAEKLAELLLEGGMRSANLVVGTAPHVIHGVGSVTSAATAQLIESIKKDKAMRYMLGLEGEISAAEMNQLVRKFGQRSSTVMVEDTDAQDYETLLKEQGVLYAKLDKQDDDHKLFIFLNRDLEKVENATTILRARRGQVTELRSDLYFNSLSPSKLHVMEGVSAVEMELFRYYARERGLLFTAIPRKDDYMIVCDQADKKIARELMLYVGWSLTGPNGAKTRGQLERRLAGRSAIQIAAEDGDKEMYIVSGVRPNQYVKISPNDYAVYKQNKRVASVTRNDPDFITKCMAACDALAHPVVMSAQQFRPDLTPDDLENAHTIDLFPEYFDALVEMERVNRLASLVARKSGLDDEHNATWGIWDPSVSYSEFAGYEQITDEDERDARQYEFEHFKQAAYYSYDHHVSNDVEMDEKSIDRIIAKAEEKRRAQQGQPRSQSGIDYGWKFNSAAREEEEERE